MATKTIMVRDTGFDVINSVKAVQKAIRLHFPKTKFTSPAAKFDGVMTTGKHRGMVVYKISAKRRG